jgi:glycine C-acetyltransferase
MNGDDAYLNYDLSHFYYGSGDDVFGTAEAFAEWWQTAYAGGYQLYQTPMASAPGARSVVRENATGRPRELINLSSYNYLGLSLDPAVKAAALDAIERFGLGAAGGPILSGLYEVHRELEAALARFFGREGAVLFPSGYSANVGIISALMRPRDHIFLDQLSHASIIDGAVLSKAKTVFFRHNQPADLARKIAGVGGRKLVVVEGIYSMDGDLAPLREIIEVAHGAGARVMVDEAHSGFVLGAHGRGAAEHLEVEEQVDIHMGTMSKAMGGLGGFAAGRRDVMDYIEAYARSRFYACTLPPAVAAGMLAALRASEARPELRTRLWNNVALLREHFDREGIDYAQSPSQILPVMVYDEAKVFRIARKVRDAGVYLQPATYPGVPKGRPRLRVSVSALHSPSDLYEAASIITRVLREEAVPCRA